MLAYSAASSYSCVGADLVCLLHCEPLSGVCSIMPTNLNRAVMIGHTGAQEERKNENCEDLPDVRIDDDFCADDEEKGIQCHLVNPHSAFWRAIGRLKFAHSVHTRPWLPERATRTDAAPFVDSPMRKAITRPCGPSASTRSVSLHRSTMARARAMLIHWRTGSVGKD